MEGIFIACLKCEETGWIGDVECDECDGNGSSLLSECPRKFVGQEMTEAINIAGLCGNGTLPVAGGLLNQSAWFLSLWQSLKSEVARIENERAENVG